MGATFAKVTNMTEDIEHNVVDFGDLLKTQNHEEILDFLRERQLDLGDLCKNGKDSNPVTVYRALLKHATNGDQLITQMLDNSVQRGGHTDENSPESYLRVSFAPLFAKKAHHSQVNHIVRDMIDFKTPATRALLTHPVIETFINHRWKKWKAIFMVNFLIYLLFLATYSTFLANIFYRKGRNPLKVDLSDLVIEQNRIIFPPELTLLMMNRETTTTPIPTRGPPGQGVDDRPTTAEAATYKFCGDKPSFRCGLEITLTILIIILGLQEILQFFTLGPRRYLSEFENWLEVIIIVLSTCGLIYQKKFILFKWFSAFGITFSYVVIIFLLGRYPMLGGSISLMFYTITKHLFKTLLSLLIIVVGFAFGFFIIHHSSGVDRFENFGKALFKTLVMAMGEFDFDDLYSGHEDPYALAFTLVLLAFLIVLVTLVLMNLLVALIVSDLDELRTSGHIQELVNKAQHIVHIESAINSLCLLCKSLRFKAETEVNLCTHSQCNCRFEKIEKHIVEELVKIVKKRQWQELTKKTSAASQSSAVNNPQLLKLAMQYMQALQNDDEKVHKEFSSSFGNAYL